MPGGSTAVPATAGHRQSALSLHQIIALSMVASLAVVVFAARSFAADHDQGAQLAATCAACHRLDGHDKGIPSIVGLSEEQFVTVMRAFKSGERSGPIMGTMARSLSNEEIAILARYFAARGKETQQR
jgi:cytochrome subunit of sulfide dehydrogenase